MSTLIIAEAGVNHNGDLQMAKELVAQAAAAGADMVKFQSFITDHSIAKSAPKATYQLDSTDPSESQFDMVRKLELSRQDHLVLMQECRHHGIEFFSTAFDFPSFDMLQEFGLDTVKIPSGEINNLPYLRYVAAPSRKILLSTGMCGLSDIESAIAALESGGVARRNITVLHCNTEYPTPMHDVNLRAMAAIRRAFGVNVGYSDHTEGIEIPIAAVALGATVIEKHFTLDRTLPGPDHRASLEPKALKAMITAIRNIEVALGDGIKRPSASEAKNIAVARKSLVASRAIAEGESFSAGNLAAKRPGTGISPMRWDEVLGRRAPRAFLQDELIHL
jgi:N,N'-diacetyllegionaminate synthase